MKSMRKKGRPSAFYKLADGTKVDGLTRLSDGRWKVSPCEALPNGKKFVEEDERLAVARFHALRARSTTVPVPLVDVTPNEFSYIPPTGWKPPTVDVDMNALWAYVREQIIANPKWVALKTGIEQIGWLTDLTEPAASPTLKEVGEEYYRRKTDLSEKEANKAESTWGDFMRNTCVQTLRELTAEAIAKWGNKVRAEGLAPKTIGHRFNRIKTILNHFRSTGRVLADVRHALDCCAVLKAPEAVSLDPHPIAREDFHKLLGAAAGEGKAMLLVGLNLCMYPIDLARLRWNDFDLPRGVYHAKRGKTKVARCGVLWGRTIDELKAISRSPEDEFVFHKASGQPHTDTTIRKWFWDLRKAANVAKEVQFADIRDGSFTEAVAGESVEFRHAQVLAGHRSGISDAYVRRAPRMVQKACEAVERAYFG